MENRLDNLFRNKLSKHKENPSKQAWDKLHGKLASNKRKVWSKRLAIAASILLFATAGYIVFRSYDSLNLKKEQHVARSIDQTDTSKDVIPSAEEPNANKSNSSEKEIKTDESGSVFSVDKDIEKSVQNAPRKVLMAETVEHKENPTRVEVTEKPMEFNVKALDTTDGSLVVYAPENEEQFAENIKPQETKSTLNTPTEKKKYGQVKIIYKASSNSSLVVSDKRKITEKGIDKITKFSNEHLLTTDRKTKLRNTKEDLLAMNFGKLLTKSNKEFEN